MANPQNLKAWQPGQSGNPKGRPADPLAAELRKRWSKSKRITELADDLEDAIDAGDLERLKLAWDRAFGRVPTPVNMDHSGDVTLTITGDILAEATRRARGDR